MKKEKVKIKNKALFDDYKMIIENKWEFYEGTVGKYSIEVPDDGNASYIYKFKKDRDADLKTLNILRIT